MAKARSQRPTTDGSHGVRMPQANWPRHVAFLRAVNVGGRTVKGPQLTEVFRGLGFAEVHCFLASGNVVFASPEKSREKIEALIEESLAAAFGMKIEVFLRTSSEVAEIGGSDVFGLTTEQRSEWNVNIALLRQSLTAPMKKSVLALQSEYDQFAFTDQEVYWLAKGKISDSKLFEGNRLVKAIGALHTVRNQRTFSRLAQKFSLN